MRFPAVIAALLTFLALPACAAQSREDFQPAQLRGFQKTEITIERRQGRDSFHVWLARSSAEQQQGLMFIRRMPADYGMLFLLEAPRPMDMWMKNTFLSLDMVFFDAGGRITHIAPKATPQSEAIISSGGTVAGVLELLGGEAQRRGIQTGDRVRLPRLSDR